VAFALAGDIDRNILSDPIGVSTTGAVIHLADLWPSGAEIDATLALAMDTTDFDVAYQDAEASVAWKQLTAPEAAIFPWDQASTYIQRPPFASAGNGTRLGRYSALPLLVLGDDDQPGVWSAI